MKPTSGFGFAVKLVRVGEKVSMISRDLKSYECHIGTPLHFSSHN